IDLSALAEPNLFPCLLARASQVRVPAALAGATATERVFAALREKKLLLLADHCDKVTEPVAHFVDTLLAACPGVQVLATSSVPLEAPGERVWQVPALEMPAELDAGNRSQAG